MTQVRPVMLCALCVIQVMEITQNGVNFLRARKLVEGKYRIEVDFAPIPNPLLVVETAAILVLTGKREIAIILDVQVGYAFKGYLTVLLFR